MTVYLVRHADSKTAPGLSDEEKLDIGLSRFGVLEAKALGERLRSFNIEQIISSPIARAKETAEIIDSYLHLGVSFDERLKEFSPDLGSRDGAKKKELKSFARKNPDEIMPSGESFNQAVDRLEHVVREVGADSSKHTCLVAHRVVIEGLLSRLFNFRTKEHEWLRNASLTAIVFQDGEWRLEVADKRYRNLRLVLETFKRRFGLIKY